MFVCCKHGKNHLKLFWEHQISIISIAINLHYFLAIWQILLEYNGGKYFCFYYSSDEWWSWDSLLASDLKPILRFLRSNTNTCFFSFCLPQNISLMQFSLPPWNFISYLRKAVSFSKVNTFCLGQLLPLSCPSL